MTPAVADGRADRMSAKRPTPEEARALLDELEAARQNLRDRGDEMAAAAATLQTAVTAHNEAIARLSDVADRCGVLVGEGAR